MPSKLNRFNKGVKKFISPMVFTTFGLMMICVWLLTLSGVLILSAGMNNALILLSVILVMIGSISYLVNRYVWAKTGGGCE